MKNQVSTFLRYAYTQKWCTYNNPLAVYHHRLSEKMTLAMGVEMKYRYQGSTADEILFSAERDGVEITGGGRWEHMFELVRLLECFPEAEFIAQVYPPAVMACTIRNFFAAKSASAADALYVNDYHKMMFSGVHLIVAEHMEHARDSSVSIDENMLISVNKVGVLAVGNNPSIVIEQLSVLEHICQIHLLSR